MNNNSGRNNFIGLFSLSVLENAVILHVLNSLWFVYDVVLQILQIKSLQYLARPIFQASQNYQLSYLFHHKSVNNSALFKNQRVDIASLYVVNSQNLYTKDMLRFLLILATILTVTSAVKVHCQHEKSTWTPNTRFQLSAREVLVPTIYDLDVFVDGADGTVSRIIMGAGYWEPRVLRNMARFVEPGYTVINVGCHIGLESVVMGKSLGPNGKLYMFQPLGISHNLALKNIYFNGLSEITTVFNAGAGSTYSKATEIIDIGNTGASRVYPNQATSGDPNRYEQVEVDQVDNMLPNDTIVNFALIDTERMELEVFNGMKNTILRSPSIIILCEWSGAYFRGTGETKKMQDVLNWFKEHNFRFYEMGPGEQQCQYAKWVQQTMQQVMDKQTYPDILFVPGHIDPNKIGV